MTVCDLQPFKYQAVSQPIGDQGAAASANNINEQLLELYLTRLLSVLCADNQAILDRLAEIESRLEALES